MCNPNSNRMRHERATNSDAGIYYERRIKTKIESALGSYYDDCRAQGRLRTLVTIFINKYPSNTYDEFFITT